MNRIYLVLAALFFPTNTLAQGFELFPQSLNPSNTIVKFEVDSTWHVIKGVAKEVSGKVWLSDATNFDSVKADILFPIKGLDTDNSMRDDRLREVMGAVEFPNVRFRLLGVNKVCNQVEHGSDLNCSTKINGKLAIRNTSRELSIPVHVVNRNESLLIRGKTSIQWADYGVEDPSILIAKLDKTVSISFEVLFESEPSENKQ